MSKVVITGCTGSIGYSLIDKHLSVGDEVYAVVRKDSSRVDTLPNNDKLHIIRCNVDELLNLTNYIDNADYFYHLAYSGVRKELRNDPYLQLNNIRYTMDAISIAKKLGCKKFLGTGSQAEYGPCDSIMSESDKVNPETGYGIAKYTAGKLGKMYADGDIEFNWVRIFSVYGLRDVNTTIVNTCISKMINNEDIDFTSATQNWEFLYMSDCANALYLVMTKGVNGKTYNISSGESKPLKDYILEIKRILTSSSNLNFGAIEQSTNVSLKSNIDSLKKDTNFEPAVSFEEGIKLVKNNYLRSRNEKNSSNGSNL